MQESVELVRLATPVLDRLVERRERTRGLRRIGQAEPDLDRLAGADLEAVVGGRLGADLRRVDGVGVPVHDERVEGVLDVGARVGRAEEPLGVRLVLGEEQRRRAIAVEPSIAELRVRRRDDARALAASSPPPGGASPLSGHQDHVLRNHRVGSR